MLCAYVIECMSAAMDMSIQTLSRYHMKKLIAVIVAAALSEGKGRLEQAALLGGQSVGGNLCLGEPECARVVRGGHERSSPQSRQGDCSP